MRDWECNGEILFIQRRADGPGGEKEGKYDLLLTLNRTCHTKDLTLDLQTKGTNHLFPGSSPQLALISIASLQSKS